MEKSYPKCVGCGYCCIKAPCSVVLMVYPRLKIGDRCPVLRWSVPKHRYICDFAKHFPLRLTIGEGCTSNLNTWRKDVKKRT